MFKLSRRSFLKLSGSGAALAAGSAIPASAYSSSAKMGRSRKAADLPKARGPRVVVVGGGWSGLTIAKYLKRENPKFDVVMIEKRAMFMSCPISNLWLADVVDLEFIHRSYLDAARNGNYIFFNATVVDVDRGLTVERVAL